MFKPIKTVFAFLLAFGLLASASTSKADWKETLGGLWGDTKENAQKGWNALVPKKPITIGMAYGTEKKKWLKWAVEEFKKTPAGKKVNVKLIPMGSVEGAEALLKEDKRIHVWSPASSLIQALLTDQWEKDHGNDPIYSDAPLALYFAPPKNEGLWRCKVYILDVPWSTQEHKDAAKLFQDFLLSEQAQRVARDQYLFRPANVDVPILENGSAFSQLQDIVKIDVGTIKRPKAKVLKLLIQTWERNAD